PGRGVVARRSADGATIHLGSPRWLVGCGLPWHPDLAAAIAGAAITGQPLNAVGWDGVIRGIFVLREQLRPEATRAIAEVRAMGMDVAVLTGDNAARGRALGVELGVPVEADQLPEDKVEAIEHARQRFGPVAMVGDGINDAPALAASDVGIAMGCGAD